MHHRERYCLPAFLAAILIVSCARVPAGDTVLKLRQRSFAAVVEVTVDGVQLNIIVRQKTRVLERMQITLSQRDATEIRTLFWDAFRHQPTRGLTPVRDLTFEQEWVGRARSQSVRIQGYPLTKHDRRAYEFINRVLPERYRFLINAGLYERRK
jgi:hypothetical protein